MIYAYFYAAIVLDHAHLACPIWLGWSNPGFRKIMLARPEKFVLLPALCIVVPVVVGATAATTREPLFRTLATIYVWWNAWHFGSQHFGIACLSGWRAGPRWMRQTMVIVPTMGLMLGPLFLTSAMPLVVVGALISLAHWLTDIGLTARVMRQWWFVPIVLLVGLIGFAWKTVVMGPQFCGVMPACTVVWSVPLLLSLRYGLGFWHFLMSRWVWKLSDPQVRATIGATF